MGLMFAYEATQLLDGEWHDRYGRAPCPICQPERRPDQRALSLRDGAGGLRLELICHNEGCGADEIIGALRNLQAWGIHYIQELEHFCDRQEERPRDRQAWLTDRRRREAQSLRIWNQARPIEGSPAEVHFRSIGVTCPLPDTLRYHDRCWHPFEEPRPAIVALASSVPRSMLQMSYLPRLEAEGGNNEQGDVYLNDVGAGVRLPVPSSGPSAPFVVTEGIESALALASGLLPGPAQFMAALSPEGMTDLRPPEAGSNGWLHPADPGFMLIAGDGSAESRRAAWRAANRAKATGLHVEVMFPPDGARWIDVLNGHATLPPEEWERIHDLFRHCADNWQHTQQRVSGPEADSYCEPLDPDEDAPFLEWRP